MSKPIFLVLLVLVLLPLSAHAAIVTLSPNDLYSIDLGGAGTTTKQIYAGDTLIATIDTANGKSTTRYVHPDILSSTNAVTDANGSLTETADYLPYGELRIDQTEGFPGEGRKYIGEEYDAATQLSYLNARYYDSTRAQFLSQDPVFLSTQQNLKDPQSLNAYSYAQDNPVTKSDPTGLLTVVVPGTRWDWDQPATMCTPSNTPLPFLDAVGNTFHETPVPLAWSGKDTSDARTAAAQSLANTINDHDFAQGEKLNVVGYSHGGSVAIQASNMNLDHKIDTLVTIGTPVRPDYAPNYNAIQNHINAYSSFDMVQSLLGGNIGVYYPEFGPAGRTYPNAKNINVMYESAPGPLKSHYDLPSTAVWSRIDTLLKWQHTDNHGI